MAILIFTSGVFEGCVIDDGYKWMDKLECKYYHTSSFKLQLLFKKWLKKETVLNFDTLPSYMISQYWRYWLDSWETEIWDANANGNSIWDDTEF